MTEQKSIFSELKGNIITLKPKVIPLTGFVYNGIQDAKNLMLFLGKSVSLNLDGSIKIKKHHLKGGEIIFRDSLGNVERVLNINDSLETRFDIVDVKEITKDHFLNIPKQEIKTKK